MALAVLSFNILFDRYKISLILFLAWILSSGIAFWIQRSQLFIGLDGSYMLDLALRQISWRVNITAVTMDWYQGLGDMFGGFNARLMPAYYIIYWFDGSDLGKTIGYTWWLIEMTVAVMVFGRSIGASAAVSALGAVVTCLLMFPFFGVGLVWSIVALAPHYASGIAVALLMASAIVNFAGRSGHNWFWGFVFASGILWFLFASAFGMILATPFIFVAAVSAIFGAQTKRERLLKGGLLLACGIFLAASGPVSFMLGVLFNTAASFFPDELQNDRATFDFASILFHWKTVGPAGPVLVVLALGGAVMAILRRDNRMLFAFSATLLTYFCTRLSFAATVIIFDFWRGPSPLYFEFFVIPLYCILAAYLLELGIAAATRMVGGMGREWHTPVPAVFGVGIISAIALPLAGSRTDWTFIFPPKPTPVTDFLAGEIGEDRDRPFRGRAANMIGRSVSGSANWTTLHVLDHEFVHAFGNDHRIAGLHRFDIPSLFAYSTTITPYFFAFTKGLLALPGDVQLRSVSVLRKIEPRILAMIGVRYVITDAPFEGEAKLRLDLPAGAGKNLRVYEIASPNLGDYSPTVVTRSPSAAAMIERMRDGAFDARHEALVSERETLPALAPSTASTLTFDGLGLRIKGHSPAQSLVLLPLEFSNCLSLKGTDRSARLLRVNLLQTGLLFSGSIDATIALRYGPFTNALCRLRDRFDAVDLGIGRAGMHRAVPD